MEKTYAEILRYLSDLNYSSGSALLAQLNSDVSKKYSAIAAVQASASTQTASASNTPPSSGYSFQSVKTDNGTFNVAIIAADLNSTRVIIDTASDSDCSNNCPVMSLGDYAVRSGAYAGINGPFFCGTLNNVGFRYPFLKASLYTLSAFLSELITFFSVSSRATQSPLYLLNIAVKFTLTFILFLL